MRKITSFLTVLLMIVLGSTEARAQMPAVSDESNTYLYYIYNARYNGYYVRWTFNQTADGSPAVPGTAVTYLGTTNSSAEANLAVRPTFKVVSTGTEGQYYLVVTNYNNESTEYYVGCSSTDSGADKVLLYTDENKVNAVWALTYTQNNGYPGITICPNGTTASWNMYQGVGNNVGLYNNDDGGATWLFVPANEAAYNKMAADVNADPIVTTYSTSSEIGKVSQTSTYYTNLVNSAAATYSESNAKPLAVNFAAKEKCLNCLYLPSGYYKMKGMDDNRVQYLYNDYLLEGNSAGYTLIGNTAETNNHIWYVANNGTTISIKNGQGTAIGRGNQNQGGANGQLTKYSTLSFQPYSDTYFTKSGGLSFTEGLNQPDNNDETSNYYIGSGDTKTYYLTAWEGHPENKGCRWTFEALGEEYTVYTVNVVGINSNYTEAPYINLTSTGEIAQNGGFFLLSSAPAASDFTVSGLQNYTGEVAVSGQTVTLTLTMTAAACFPLLQTKITEAESLLANMQQGLAYPSENARNTFQNAINVAKSFTAETATEQSITDLSAAMTAFSSTTDVVYPENGKVYTITYDNAAGNKAYLYWNGTTVTAKRMSDGETIGDDGKFVCRKILVDNADKFVFVNAKAGNYMVWQCDQETYCPAGANCGHMTTYDAEYCNWNLKVSSSTSSGGNKSYPGKFLLEGQTKKKGLNYLLVKVSLDNPTFHSCSTGQSYYDNDLSSFCKIEEVEYPNNVTLNQAVGINDGDQYIATFSAPFATVVPENTAAYVIYQTGTSSVTMEKLADAGAAIPANTGVLLYGSATSATMLPATSETQATLTGTNKLEPTAGAALDMTSVEKAYILGKPSDSDPVAFYACSGGTLAMNKAYLCLADEGTSESAAALTIDFGNTTTALQQVATEAAMEAPMYDLSGRRVLKVQKGGLYIQNGKKYIVK